MNFKRTMTLYSFQLILFIQFPKNSSGMVYGTLITLFTTGTSTCVPMQLDILILMQTKYPTRDLLDHFLREGIFHYLGWASQ